MKLLLLGKGNTVRANALREQLVAGASGFKLHEDWGTTPAAIDACLRACDEYGVQAAIHTDTLNEAGYVQDTLDAIGGRVIHTYHTEGAGGGHAPDIVTVVSQANVLPSSTNPTRPHTVNTADSAQVTVVDLHNLPDRAQRFVVGVTLKTEFERKEKSGSARPLLFVVLDELNRYAPREGSSPIKEVLLDIAERGRSLGVILIGAQQTASEVERRIVANSSVKVVGRLDPAEAGRPEYGFLPASQRIRATLAKPGTMFVSQPEIPVPLAVEFPFPAWATRLSESAGEAVATNGAPPRDPFARMATAAEDDDAPF